MRELICGTTVNASLSPSGRHQGEQAVNILWALCRHLSNITDARPSIFNVTLMVDQLHHAAPLAKPAPNQH